jgi:hypothetical protein
LTDYFSRRSTLVEAFLASPTRNRTQWYPFFPAIARGVMLIRLAKIIATVEPSANDGVYL